ncbi:hypothetical protein KEH51_14140 [[Brevibacterium] frigoritolerans]|uniref:Uncharacterized protein n=1 Tax=Peribacillus frigoritolerans TaxID=450367 RepID=A0A941FKB7_9BACI|nr:hypothetical protein [Peribacillus frigoritolerans]
MQTQYLPYYHYPQTIMLQNDYRNAYGNEYGPEYWNDERFFPFFPLLAPVAFVAGLAVDRCYSITVHLSILHILLHTRPPTLLTLLIQRTLLSRLSGLPATTIRRTGWGI